MQSDDFLHQQIRELNWSLMGENHSEFGKYLQTVWKEGKGWDQLYQEVILADYRNDQASGAPAFLKKRVSDLDRLTNDVAIQFFGVNISCAQCHDHPNVPHWTQASYYGMKSFFSATFDNGGFVAERSEGEVTYKNTRGETLEASLQFFDRPPIEETLLVRLDDEGRKKEKERLEQLKKKRNQRLFQAPVVVNCSFRRAWPMHKVVILPARPSTGSGSNSWEEDWLSRSTKCMEPIPQPIQNCFSGFPNGFSIMGTTLGSSLLPWSAVKPISAPVNG